MQWLNIWTLSRAAGFGSYILLTLSVLAGLYLSYRTARRQPPSPTLTLLHQDIAYWAFYTGAFHALILLFDRYVQLGWQDLLVPFSSEYRTLPMGLGIIAIYLLIGTLITTELRGRLGHKLWKKLHMLSPLAYILLTVHGILTGDPSSTAEWLPMYALSVMAVCIMLVLRIAGSLLIKESPIPYTENIAESDSEGGRGNL